MFFQWVAFHVEADIQGRRRRQECEATARIILSGTQDRVSGRDRCGGWSVLTLLAGSNLEIGLLRQALLDFGAQPGHVVPPRSGQLRHGHDPCAVQLLNLAKGDAGDLDQVIPFLKISVCVRLPATVIGSRLRHRGRLRIKSVHLVEERLLDEPIIVKVIERPKLPFRPIPQDDPHTFGQRALNGFQHFGVGAQLNQVVRFDRVRQFGVPRFVSFAARQSDEEIRIPGNRGQFETGLIDDFVARLDGLDCDSLRFRRITTRHAKDFPAQAFEVIQIRRFVLVPGPCDQPLFRSLFVRLNRVREFEVKPLHPTRVRRIELPDQVRRRINQLVGAFLHDSAHCRASPWRSERGIYSASLCRRRNSPGR